MKPVRVRLLLKSRHHSAHAVLLDLALEISHIAHGPQQVNNEAAQPSRVSRARETEKQPNKLLEAWNDERLDTERDKPP
jgi:hypothetical protein